MRTITRLQCYCLVVAGLIAQLLFVNALAVFGTRPDLLFVLVVFFGLFGPKGMAREAGIAAGFLKDLFGTDPFGVMIITYAAVGYFVETIAPRFFRESPITQFFVTFTSYLLSAAVYTAAKIACVGPTGSGAGLLAGRLSMFTAVALPTALYTSLIAVIVFSWMMRVYNFKETALI
ncbi:MAG: rod shape-determining protein MreD [Candidatus Omnitrophota bacterium]